MTYRELEVPGAWEVTPQPISDDRGLFLEYFRSTQFSETTGHHFELAQANCSVSAAGVVRGIHFADVPPGQAKYVTCARGAVIDIVVDIRVGSPTYGRWDSVLLDDVDRRAIYIGEGLGHAFMALEDDSTVLYLCSTGYAPGREHGIHALDQEIGVEWPTVARDGSPLVPRLSEKDLAAPTLAQAAARGLLPRYDEVTSYVTSLRG